MELSQLRTLIHVADLGSLGPLGFYLSQHVGSHMLLALGLAWPFAVGTLSWLWAHASFSRGDLV